MTREEWLLYHVELFREKFIAAGKPLPEKVHVSVGFPSKGGLLGSRSLTIGQCWQGCSSDGNPHIFVSPVHGDGVGALSTLLHELAHAALPKGVGHKAEFVKLGKALGLTSGKPKSLCAGTELAEELTRLNNALPFPHAALDARSLPKAQSTRLVKVMCGDCGYVARVTRVWLDGPGAPVCPTCETQMEE